MQTKIAALLDKVKTLTAENLEQVEALRIQYISKKGEVSKLLEDFRSIPNEEKRTVGAMLNELKAAPRLMDDDAPTL